MGSPTMPLDASRDTVLVTGGAGYIGSHACKVLRAAGRRVVLFDNLSEGHRAAALGAELVVGDTRDVELLRSVIRSHRVGAVMHFAAWAAVGESVKDPAGYYDNNVVGTLSLLKAMVAERVAAFIFSSTCAVFGEPTEVPIPEHHITSPINSYGETKLTIERLLPHYLRAYGLRSCCLRYFNAAGADPEGELGEDHNPERHLIPLAMDAVLGGAPIQVFGTDYPTPDGTCLRDYIHVMDLAQAHVLALQSLEHRPQAAIYNVGNGQPHSVKEVLAAVERVAGAPVPHSVGPRRPGDPAVLFASSGRIRSELGWEPKFGALDFIIETAWQWRQTHPKKYGDRAS
jgi:UDP-glucose-4-epimerase GalE